MKMSSDIFYSFLQPTEHSSKSPLPVFSLLGFCPLFDVSFFTALLGMWDLSSLTRVRTPSPEARNH